MHKVISRPKRQSWIPLSEICELKGSIDEYDPTTPISHPWEDCCKRNATVWIYDIDGVWGLCNICYGYCFPCKNQWYRIIRISDDFNGQL